MNDQDLERSLDNGIEESFPASDPVSIVCLPANEERFAQAMKAARDHEAARLRPRRLRMAAIATGIALAGGASAVALLDARARQQAALQRRGMIVRAALAAAGALVGTGVVRALVRA